jgi:glycosyltransferase involved in cell wall biosynthesis
MKILQVNKFFYLKGGSEAYLFSLIDGLEKSGHTVAEFAMNDPKNQQSDWENYFTSVVGYDTANLCKKVQFAGKIIYSFEARKKIGRLLDMFRPDIVHLHIFQHQLSASILPEIRNRNIPIVYTAHDLKSICPNYKMLSHGVVCEECKGHKYYNCLKNKCVKNSSLKSLVNVIEMYFHHWMKYYELIDLIITPSDFYRDKLVAFRFPEEKVIHIPNFVDESLFSPSYENEGYFIYLGRLSEEKGILTLLNAMKEVPGGRLIIIGAGPLEGKVKAEVETSPLLLNVQLVGFQSGEALKKYIAGAMFSIIPSEWYENGSISLLENFACGKPVIGADIGGIPEHIDHGRDGLIFKSKDCADLADKINELLSVTHTSLVAMGKCARQKVEKLYSKSQHINKITSIYENLK